MPRRGEKTKVFTTIPSKRVVVDCEIYIKDLSKKMGTGMCEALPLTLYIYIVFKTRIVYYFKGTFILLYIQKWSLGGKEYNNKVNLQGWVEHTSTHSVDGGGVITFFTTWNRGDSDRGRDIFDWRIQILSSIFLTLGFRATLGMWQLNTPGPKAIFSWGSSCVHGQDRGHTPSKEF